MDEDDGADESALGPLSLRVRFCQNASAGGRRFSGVAAVLDADAAAVASGAAAPAAECADGIGTPSLAQAHSGAVARLAAGNADLDKAGCRSPCQRAAVACRAQLAWPALRSGDVNTHL